MEKHFGEDWIRQQNPSWLVPSDNCYAVIKHFEGCELNAYKDAVGVITIGYGNTFYEDGKPVKMGDSITRARAERLLPAIVTKFAIDVNQMVREKLQQHQFDALVSLVYNIGPGNFKSSTLLRLINERGNDKDIAAQFCRWDKAKGKVLAGLTRRRKTEANLFLTGKVNFYV